MDFAPVSGDLWLEQNGDVSCSELDRVLPGMNGGWIQVMGPIDRIDEFKAIDGWRPPPAGPSCTIGRTAARPTALTDTCRESSFFTSPARIVPA